jgi:8-oxo-dGTP pyrophosphatase MutT (NUDIX family)
VIGWPALAAALAHDAAARVPFVIAGCRVGSVAREHLPALAAWPRALRITPTEVTLSVPAAERDATLAGINAALHAQGWVRGWRDETYAIVAGAGGPRLARTERAASRFWGTLTFGAHASGYVAGARGQPARLWIARRALTKQTDPGLLDNLVGGGVPDGQTPLQTLVREAWEEAGLQPAQLRAARPGRVLRLQRDVAEGLQLEHLHSFDLELPAGVHPANQDGEVAGFECLEVDEALARAAAGAMTVDAALVTLDFALRHRLLPPAVAPALEAAIAPLFVSTDGGAQNA